MSRYDRHEIAILPCLPPSLTIEDEMLEATAPSFGLAHVRPNAMLARVLTFLNVSKGHFLDLVEEKTGIRPSNPKPDPNNTGPWRHRHELAADWRTITVKADENRPQLLSDAELTEVFDNATYGGQLAIAGTIDGNFCLPATPLTGLTVWGRFQIGIIDYVWGSGHAITFDGKLTLDMRSGQAGSAPGYSFNSVCDFMPDYFAFDFVGRADVPRGLRWHAERRAPAPVPA